MPSSLYDLTATSIDGTSQPLAQYAGKVALVVNTASECGFTPQYDGLEKLWQELKDRGVVVLGFPSNEFGGQEPGGEAQIQEFCRARFGVSFPLFAKVHTKGKEQSPIYAFLTSGFGEPRWNFHKFLVGKDGAVRAAFPSKVAPTAPELRTAIDAALAG